MNYDKEMLKIIDSLDYKPKLLLHSCCGPCSTSVIEQLKDKFEITVLYYNPNIEPLEEYEKRKLVQLKVLNKFNIDFLDIDYDNEKFKKISLGLENAPEGGARCSKCYLLRLDKTAKLANKKGFEFFTTTLTVSPYKNSKILNEIGKKLEETYNIKYLVSDFKKREGYKRSLELSKLYELYRQEYCGCLFSLNYMKKERDLNE